MNYAIFDLDNCLSDDGWRIPKINWQKTGYERYHTYHTLAPFDRVDNVLFYSQALLRGEGLIIFTARPVQFRDATERWLFEKGIPFTHLFMRNNHDSHSAVEVKRAQLAWLTTIPEYRCTREQIVHAYDDHPDIVSMYRDAGIDAKLLAIHDLNVYQPPEKT